MRAELTPGLTEGQTRAAQRYAGGPLCVSGPAGSGKTTALAARAIATSGSGVVLVVCPNRASCEAFSAALRSAGGGTRAVSVDTLAGHLAALLRAEFAAAGASPDLQIGSDADSEALALRAGASILDMTWPGFRGGFSLDLPFLGRPEIFFEEAAGLFRLLRRSSVAPEEFASGCEAGIGEFYGDDVERARALIADPNARNAASRRGREAMTVDAGRLRVQKKAERDLSTLLAALYEQYVSAARGARVLCAEDVVDEGIRFLRRDASARARFARGIDAVIVDDAEDAELATRALLELLRSEGVTDVAAASCAASAIEGLGGRRSLTLPDDAVQVDLPPRAGASAARSIARYENEDEEADAIAADIRGLFASGVAAADIIVLARDIAGAGVYARLLAERGVPVAAEPDAWQAPADIADLLALACAVDDPYDHAHLLRVLASPLVALSDASLLTLCRAPDDATQLMLDVADADARGPAARGMAQTTLAENVLYGHADMRLSERARASLAAFRERWHVWRAACATMPAPAVLAFLIEDAGFKAAWHAAPQHLRARLAEDGERLIAASGRVGAASAGAAARALEAGFSCVESARGDTNAVTCRTIAGAKGIRRPYVFVAGVAHERFPRVYVSRGLAFSKRYGLIARENVAGGPAQTAKFAWYYAKFGAKRLYIEEERRALEYALTRADVRATATGFGSPPRWAADHDLLARHGA